jgi:hypothetical protein
MPRVSVLPRRALALALVGALALPPEAADARTRGAERMGDAEPAEDTARTLFDEGSTAYDTSDYNLAIRKFTEAYAAAGTIADEDTRKRVLAGLLFNLSRAHVEAYGVDRDVSHLRIAKDLFKKYQSRYGEADFASMELQAKIDKLLAEAEAEPTPASASAGSDDATAPRSAGAVDNPPKSDGPAPGRGLIIGGITSLAVGVAGLGLLGGGAAIVASAEDDYAAGPTRDDRDAAADRGATGDTLVTSGAVVASVGLIAGAALLAVGLRRRKSASVAVLPSLSPTAAALTLRARF